MIKVSKFQTSDGKIFDTSEEAKQHESIQVAVTRLTDVLKASLATGRPESIVRQIIMEHIQIGSILKTHSKKAGKAN